jgi:hypothetical protein
MKKVSLLLCCLLLGVAFAGFAQTTPSTDFFAGKWEITVVGTPNGDVKLVTNLVRKDGKLTGELVNQADTTAAKLPIKKIEESADKLAIFFDSSQAGELSIDLTKVDENNLKGNLMSLDATARRLK